MLRRIHDPERGANFVEYAAIILLVAAIASTLLASGITDRPARLIANALDSVGSDTATQAEDTNTPGATGAPEEDGGERNGDDTEPPPGGGNAPADQARPAADARPNSPGSDPQEPGDPAPEGIAIPALNLPGIGSTAPTADLPLGLGNLAGIAPASLPGAGLLEPIGQDILDGLPGHDRWLRFPDGFRITHLMPNPVTFISQERAEDIGFGLEHLVGFDHEAGEIITGTLEGLVNTVLHPVETGRGMWSSLTGTIGQLISDAQERADTGARRWDEGRRWDSIRGWLGDTARYQLWDGPFSLGGVLVNDEARGHFRNGDYGRGAAQIAASLVELIPGARGAGAARRLPTPEPPDRPGTGPQQLADGQRPDGQGRDPDRDGDGDGPTCRRPSSFVPGTPVLLADGTTAPIEDVAVGDEVLAFDPLTGEEGPREVTDLISSSGTKTLVTLTIDDDQGSTSTLTATDEHPFWVPETATWVDAIDLEPGSWLRTSAGTWAQVTAVDARTSDDQRVHNLTVDNLNTYYALAGDAPVLVHNSNCAPDLGSAWEARDPASIPGDTGGCEACAIEIQSKLGGGEIMRISPPPGMPFLWKYRGHEVQWNVHYAVVKDGRVFDAWTGRTGESLDEYMGQWEDAHETTATDRGALAPNPDSGGYRFTPDG